jgi:hypothetical protein
MCALIDTLIIDSDGIYELGCFNDRLLLGLRGTISEAESHLLASRLQGAELVVIFGACHLLAAQNDYRPDAT